MGRLREEDGNLKDRKGMCHDMEVVVAFPFLEMIYELIRVLREVEGKSWERTCWEGW